MDDTTVDDLSAFLPPLLQALESLGLVGRHFNPAAFGDLMDAIGTPDAELAAVRTRLDGWPAGLADVRDALTQAADHALAAFEALRTAPDEPDGLGAVFRALGRLPRATEALYPLAGALPPLSRFFLDPPRRGDNALVRRLADATERDDTGILHFDNEPGSRGGFSVYVPEYYSYDREWPVVFALHGGAGNGRSFLWSWLRDARTYGWILVSPTATGRTWAIQGQDADTPNLARMLGAVRGHWRVDPTRLLLSGMSDGGTFSYVSGLEPGSPFTHLAPTSAAFHPMMAQYADPDRLAGLPIHITHGVHDWMFDVGMAREASEALTRAGAAVTYWEVPDLAHTFPRELNADVLRWADATVRR